MKITAINDSHAVGFAESIITIGEVYMTNVKSMVIKVLAKANGNKITRLRISDHGQKDGCYFGADWISLDNFENYAADLMVLSPAFAKDAFVHLTHCLVGNNENLLQLFAAAFGVTVYAATGTVNSLQQVSDGTWTRCSPSGTIYRNAFFPGESDYVFSK